MVVDLTAVCLKRDHSDVVKGLKSAPFISSGEVEQTKIGTEQAVL